MVMIICKMSCQRKASPYFCFFMLLSLKYLIFFLKICFAFRNQIASQSKQIYFFHWYNFVILWKKSTQITNVFQFKYCFFNVTIFYTGVMMTMISLLESALNILNKNRILFRFLFVCLFVINVAVEVTWKVRSLLSVLGVEQRHRQVRGH